MFQQRCIVALTLFAAMVASGRADIYRWNDGTVIPGTTGVTPGRGVILDHLELSYAALSGLNLTDARLDYSNLTSADLRNSTLTRANLSGANLTNALLVRSRLTQANLSGAVVTGAILNDTTPRGFTEAQLASTASYQAKNLTGIYLSNNDLTGWDFSGQNLTRANLGSSTLTQANLSGANLTNAYLWSSTLTQANLSGAIVAGVGFSTSRGFTQAQLVSTASYQAKSLMGIGLEESSDLTGWDLSGQDLTNAYLASSTLTQASLSGANLTHASLETSTLTQANLSGAVVAGASFGETTSRGFTQAQLASTASYQAKNLMGIGLDKNDLTGWDLSGQNLTHADLGNSTLTQANLSGANLKNANLDGATDVQAAVASSTIYNQWTAFPANFDPVASGLTLMSSALGDFDANDVLDIADIDFLQFRIRHGYVDPSWLPMTMFDMNGDAAIDSADVGVWVKELQHTWFGDADLDGEFTTTDLVHVFQSGQYEDKVTGNSTWSTGDWDTDGEFTTSDLVLAFQDGGYEAGPRIGVAAVPEPGSLALLLMGLCRFIQRRTVR